MTPPAVVRTGWCGRGLEAVSGDAHVMLHFEDGALIGLIDGLGHGPEAAEASKAASAVLESDPSLPVKLLIERCHEGLHGTRGAVLTLASFDTRTSMMTWGGVGNVDAMLLRRSGTAHASAPVRAGVVGFRIPALRVDTLPISRGDTLILTTDGIRTVPHTTIAMDHSPQEIAESILVRHARADDDAHVVVARYLGGAT